MPGRTGKLLFAAGFAVVLALAVGLVLLTRGATVAAPPSPAAHTPPPALRSPVVERPATASPSVAAREHVPPPAAPHPQAAMPTRQPELAPAPGTSASGLQRDPNGKLVPMIPVQVLRERMALVAAPMAACIESSGQRPTGKATLNFTVAARNNQLVVETTGVQDEDSLAGYSELLACMHRTAKLLLPAGSPVPEYGTPIYIRRHVQLDNGAIVEDSLFNFSYNP